MVLRRTIVIGRNPEIQQLVRNITEHVLLADDPAEAVDIARTVRPDLVLLGHDCTVADVRTCTERITGVPVVITGGSPDEQRATHFSRLGIYDYLPGPLTQSALDNLVSRIADGQRPRTTSAPADYFAADFAQTVGLVGRSRAMHETLRMIELVAASKCNPVLIVGETGTGKELAANAVHALRHPAEQFVAVNCAALTSNLLESELFGHVRGSFTSADRDKTGLLELAGQGTIFLDEISEAPIELQAKLLRVLQDKTFRKVGGVTDLTCRATIIASSNRDLRKEVQCGRFRQDLYYRLNICPITMPSLRSPDRRDDIRLLAEHFLKTSTVCPDKTPPITALTAIAAETLESHNWPGNVRELRNVIERAIVLETTDRIGLSSIIIEDGEPADAFSPAAPMQIRDFSLEKAERELISRALQETGWQKTRAASLLGITRATLYAKVRQHNISRGAYLPKDPDESWDPASEQPIPVS